MDPATATTTDGLQTTKARLPVSIRLDYSDRVNFAMQQNKVALVDWLTIRNDGEQAVHSLSVVIALENDAGTAWSTRIERIEAGESFKVEPTDLALSGARLAQQTEAERTRIRVSVESPQGDAEAWFPIDILAFDQWPGVGHFPELLGAFATPNHPKVAELLTNARTALGTLSGRDALDGYQGGSRLRAAQIAESCFNALVARGIGYINPPASFDREGQRIRLVDRVCREKFGSCLDLSLLLASLWEQSGLHPLILLMEGHAIPAVWTHEAHLAEPAIDEAARIRNLLELGEIVAVESTLATQSGSTFAQAVEAAKRRLASPGAGFCAVDIRSCRKRGVRPLPLRADGDASSLDLSVLEPDVKPATADTVLQRVALADRVAAGSKEAAAAESGEQRIKRWQTRLLDLSLRNRLISFRSTGKTLQLMVPDLAKLENLLADEGRFGIYPKSDGDEAYRRQELDARHVYSAESDAETQKRLLQLYRIARSSIEETGANLLHLALGMLKWFETETTETPRYAPLILLPITLTRYATGAGYRYDLALSDEPLRPNVTLLEKLRTEFGIATGDLAELPEDEKGIDVEVILRRFRDAIRDTKRWEVEETAFLGLFSFNKFLMWKDLQENISQLRKNRLVTHLMDRSAGEFDPSPFPRPEDLDDEVQPGELLCTRDADSTQLAAIRAAGQARTFVLEGPPGTGKSQTIANIIADSLGHGKRVLFVAEKMAALSVVRHRLETDGLGPFCLELHSAQASKKEVLAQLEAGLAVMPIAEPHDWSQMCEDLRLTRDQLNAYVRELHATRSTGESLFQVLGRITRLGDGARIKLPMSDLTGVSREQLGSWRSQITSLVAKSGQVDPVTTHPLRGIGLEEFRFGIDSQSRSAIDDAARALASIDKELAALITAIGAGVAHGTLDRDSIQAIALLANLLQSSPSPDARMLVGADAAALVTEVARVAEIGVRRDHARRDLLTRYRPEFLQLDHLQQLEALRRAEAWPGPLAKVTVFLARRKLRPYCTARVPDAATLRPDLETVGQIKRDTESVGGSTRVSEVLGSRWNAGDADWAGVQALLEWCRKFHKCAEVIRKAKQGPALLEGFARVAASTASHAAAVASAVSFATAWAGWARCWDQLKATLNTTGTEAFGPSDQPEWISRAQAVLSRWAASLTMLNDWCSWRRARTSAMKAGLTDAVEQYECGRLKRTMLSDAFERSYGEVWFNAVANSLATIREFNAASHGSAIERFGQMDTRLIARTRFAIAARLAQKVPSTSAQVSGQSELGILRRELQKKRKHLPTRRLIESMPNLLARLKPCFLMSPLSVAQYLDAKLPPFDLVVFDEASQIPVWDAIGAIARGAEVVVVGDSKQLPPTSFFETVDGEDDGGESEDLAVEDMESILQECNASGIPAMMLSWHYRSRHESLIAFSNHHYYQNRLHTFPSPQDRSIDLGVTFHHVPNGVYDRGGSRTNRIEAGRVVDEVVRLLTNQERPDSIGIVTFNQAQQTLIEDLLDAKRRTVPEIERFFTNQVSEPVFIKNLENVQGDERDTIIFSVGYGPDQTGRPSMNFGPLNKDGGERRLNVAVTRARRRLMVFSSLRSDQIDLKRTRSLGVKHFKTFLDYADRGPRAITEAVHQSGTREFESGFEKAVWQALTDRGWEVDTQVGCAGYRVDLGVRDPDRPGRYLLGIECDGAAYHSAKTARDRDRLRQSVLEQLGWRIARIWSTEWRINPDRCVSAVEAALAECKKDAEAGSTARSSAGGDAAAPSTPTDDPANVAAPSAAAGSSLYAQATIPVSKPNAAQLPDIARYEHCRPAASVAGGDIFESSWERVAIESLCKIVQFEGPIVEELASRRLAEWFGVQRITDRCRDRLAQIRAGALRSGAIISESGVLWPRDTAPSTYTSFRAPGATPDDRRDIEDVPLIERINAVVHVLDQQIGLPHEDLERETARLFGVMRLTARGKSAMREAIDHAIRTGRAVASDGQVTLAVR